MSESNTDDTGGSIRTSMRFRLVVFVTFFLVSLAYTIESLDFYVTTRYTPLYTGTIATVLGAVVTFRELVRLYRLRRDGPREYSRSLESELDAAVLSPSQLRSSLKYSIYVIVFTVATVYLGLLYAAPAFIGLMLLFDARRSVLFTMISMAGAVVFIRVAVMGGLRFPRGLLF